MGICTYEIRRPDQLALNGKQLAFFPTFVSMKLFTFIFSLYFLALSTVPCGDLSECDQSSPTTVQSTTEHDNHQHKSETCSPFCFCTCCGSVFNNDPSPTLSSIETTVVDKPQPAYRNSFLTEIYCSIWHPPKIS